MNRFLANINNGEKQGTPKNLWFWGCCVLMFVGFAVVFLSSLLTESLTQAFLAASPLLLCMGMHLLIHRFAGRKCHGGNSESN